MKPVSSAAVPAGIAVAFETRKHCPACNATERKFVADLSLTEPPLSEYLAAFYDAGVIAKLPGLAGNRYRLARCAQCGTHYQTEVPPAAWLERFYSSIQVPGNEPVPTFVFEQRARELAMIARQLDHEGLPKKALDFGVGTGGWARLALAAGFTVHAMDVAAGAFPALEAAGIRCSAPFMSGERDFSLIHVEQVFEHLAAPGEVMRQLADRLRGGGIMVIGVPHDPNLAQKLRAPRWHAAKHEAASLNAVAPLEHLNAFSPEGLRSFGARHQLEELQPRGWQLHARANLPRDIRSRLGTKLRQRLREHYQPAWALTQTVFFRKPPVR